MLPYWLKYWEKSRQWKPECCEKSNGKKMVVSNCAVCVTKKSRFIIEA